MAKFNLTPISKIDGFVVAALVNSDTGRLMAAVGSSINLEIAAAGNSEVIRSKRRVAAALKLNDEIEDILITFAKQYHIIRPLLKFQRLFLYVVVDRARANLALVRLELKAYEQTLQLS